MGKIDPEALEAVIKDAGIGTRVAKKLRDANGDSPDPISETKVRGGRGHGAPSQDLSPLSQL